MTLDWPTLLPLIFAGLMGLSILIYVVLDGFDLGIGILFALAERRRAGHDDRRHRPVLGRQRDLAGAGRRPAAGRLSGGARHHPDGALPAGLRAAGRAHPARRRLRFPRQGAGRRASIAGTASSSPARSSPRWRRATCSASMCSGCETGLAAMAFGALVALCLAAAYAAMGAAWLIYKTEGELQKKAVLWLRARAGVHRARHGGGVAGHALRLAAHLRQWFVWPDMLYLSPLPILSGAAVPVALAADLPSAQARRPPRARAVPDAGGHLRARLLRARLVVLPLRGARPADHLAGGVGDREPRPSSWSARVVVLPIIIVYSFYAYRVFSGKATDLTYD